METDQFLVKQMVPALPSRSGNAWARARKAVMRSKTMVEKRVARQIRRSWLFNMLSHKSKTAEAIRFKRIMMWIITSDVFLFIISTVPTLAADPAWSAVFKVSEVIFCSIFLLEYVLRVYVCTEKAIFAHPVLGRLRYVLTTSALIDLVSFLPFFIEIASMGRLDMPRTSIIRVLRLYRLLRTEKYVRAVAITHRILWFNREILSAAFLNCLVLTFVTSTLLYYLPPKETAAEFESLPSTIYLSILLLTGQGLEFEGKLPWWTKAIIILTAIFSVAMFAIPASMITWGFEAEAARLAKKAAIRRRAMKLKPGAASSGVWSQSSSDNGSSDSQEGFQDDDSGDSWEEYEEAVAGGLDEDEDDEVARAPTGGHVRLGEISGGNIEDRLSKLEGMMAQVIEGQKKMIKAVEKKAA